MALNILDTNGATVAKSGAEFEAYDVIRYSGASPSAPVSLTVSDSSAADLADELGSVSANVTGSSDDNTIETGAGNDTIKGGAGNDLLTGGEGNDQISGGTGNDVIRGGAGDDTITDNDGYSITTEDFDIDAGDGNDKVSLQGGPAVYSGLIDGGAGADVLRAYKLSGLTIKNVETLETTGATVAGTAAQFEGFDKIVYLDGTESAGVELTLTDSAHADLSDELVNRSVRIGGVASGIDVKTGGGDDLLAGTNGSDTFDGSAGNDWLSGDFGNDVLIGGDGDDHLLGDAGSDVIRGGVGNDVIYDSADAEVFDIDAGDGDDAVYLQSSNLLEDSGIVDGGAGTDTLEATNLIGLTIRNFEILGAGPDIAGSAAQFESFDKIIHRVLTLADSAHADLSDELASLAVSISGTAFGIDVTTGSGDDQLFGTDGNDTFDGRAGNDMIYGYAGNDMLVGGEGDDQIYGDIGNDVIKGGAGDDRILDGAFYIDGEIFDIDAGDGRDLVSLENALSVGASGTVDGGDGVDTLQAFNFEGLTIRNFETLETQRIAVVGSAAQFESFDKIVIYDEPGYENEVVSLVLTDSSHADLADELANRPTHIYGGAFGIDVETGSGRDHFYGTAGNDTFAGNAGDDTFQGNAGDDTIYGGAGSDTAILIGNFADYSLGLNNGSHILTSAFEGRDTLTEVEFARFADGVYDFAAETFKPDNTAPTNVQLSKTALSEDTPIWTTVGLLSAKDADGDALTYTLIDGADDHFRLNGNRIVTSKALDYETDKSHTIKVAVSDGTVTVEKDITINVLDVNEAPANKAPTNLAFSRSSVSENVAIGTSVGLLTARDPEGGAVRWRLTDDADGIFKLVGNKIQTKAAIDYETTHSLTFTAEAYDAAGNVTSHDFTLAVKDVFELSVSSLSHEALI
ncbi:metal-binding protein [Rhizobium leguminosarum bv. trifolii WSM1689]|uniref:metal-binding protein n=1 Tax=Rhizobium leguminosarum TaxID=384 RepID=UPI0003E095D0|nr:metal-binding protein [Rhizobium leguminosarum]AHF84526.1 metal-binding protein [Rhizobium leguminosarum bv. trifolii WSM1689]MBY5736009.1 metal-binding protein [Rhizobium leguminosarum]